MFHAGRYQPVPLVDNPTSQQLPHGGASASRARESGSHRHRPLAAAAARDGARPRGAEMQMEPRRTLVPLAQAVIAMSQTATATPPTNTGIVPIEPIMAAPKFPQPMYESLRDLSQQLLLPGLETVEPNSVLGLETNSRFVEAYMVGLNFEMGRELLWRGYPTDQRGTYFDRFWDSRSSGGGADVNPIHALAGPAARRSADRAGGRSLRHADPQLAAASLSVRSDLRGEGDQAERRAQADQVARGRGASGVPRLDAAGRDVLRLRPHRRPGRRHRRRRRSRLLHRDPGAAGRAALRLRCRHAAERGHASRRSASARLPARRRHRTCTGVRTARTSPRCFGSSRCVSRSMRRSS